MLRLFFKFLFFRICSLFLYKFDIHQNKLLLFNLAKELLLIFKYNFVRNSGQLRNFGTFCLIIL